MPENKGPHTHDETKLLPKGPGENNIENSTENFTMKPKGQHHTTAASYLSTDQEETTASAPVGFNNTNPRTTKRPSTTKTNNQSCLPEGQERTTEKTGQRTS